MVLDRTELIVLHALSRHLAGGCAATPVSLPDVVQETGLRLDVVREVFHRFDGRGWGLCAGRLVWDEEECLILMGEGLAAAAAIARRRDRRIAIQTA